MTVDEAMGIMKEATVVAFQLGGPLLIVNIVVGLVVAIFQAVTQIHEQTLTLVSELIVIALLLSILGAWMYRVMGEFVIRPLEIMASLQDGGMA